MAWVTWSAAASLSLVASLAVAAPPRSRKPASEPADELPPDAALGQWGNEQGGDYNTCRRFPPTKTFRVTLPEEAELKDLVRWMSSISCQKFIVDPAARAGKVTVLSPEPVTLAEAYAAFDSALNVLGLTVEPAGDYYKIVEVAGAQTRAMPIGPPGSQPSSNDRYVTQLYRPRNGDPAGIADLMGHFVTKNGAVHIAGDFVIVTDTGASIRRILQIVRHVDKAPRSTERVYLFQLRHADPESTAAVIREVFGEKDGAAPRPGKSKKKK